MDQTNTTQKQKQQEQEEETEQKHHNHHQQQLVWSWGAGTDGQLATVKLQDEHIPQFLSSFVGPISTLSCGGAHVVALTPDGKVFTWGRGSSGQLGHGDIVDHGLVPKQVEALDGIVILHVSAGWNHSGFVSDDGAVFTCGDGSFGQLGHGDYKSQSSPLRVSYFSSSHVEQIACGMRHSIVLLGENVEHQVYGFGSGKRGQLGVSHEKVKTTNSPQITMGFANDKIVSVSANGDHSAALSDDGSLYTWGRGFGCASDTYIPRLLNASCSFSQVALGWNHALLLTKEGTLCMLGGDRHGVLSDPQKTSLMSNSSGISANCNVQIIHEVLESRVVHIAAGAEHSALVSDNGSIMTWGWGEHGQLGLGNTSDRTVPQVVSLDHELNFEKHAISRVYCGSGFSFVLRTYYLDSQT